jgi:hypothetical protein
MCAEILPCQASKSEATAIKKAPPGSGDVSKLEDPSWPRQQRDWSAAPLPARFDRPLRGSAFLAPRRVLRHGRRWPLLHH